MVCRCVNLQFIGGQFFAFFPFIFVYSQVQTHIRVRASHAHSITVYNLRLLSYRKYAGSRDDPFFSKISGNQLYRIYRLPLFAFETNPNERSQKSLIYLDIRSFDVVPIRLLHFSFFSSFPTGNLLPVHFRNFSAIMVEATDLQMADICVKMIITFHPKTQRLLLLSGNSHRFLSSDDLNCCYQL